jgi:hypothetical protein
MVPRATPSSTLWNDTIIHCRIRLLNFLTEQLIYLHSIKLKSENLRTLTTLQNKAISAIFYEEYRDPSVHTHMLFQKQDLLDFRGLRCYETLNLILSIRCGSLKNGLDLVLCENIHEHSTRNKSCLYLGLVCTRVCQGFNCTTSFQKK